MLQQDNSIQLACHVSACRRACFHRLVAFLRNVAAPGSTSLSCANAEAMAARRMSGTSPHVKSHLHDPMMCLPTSTLLRWCTGMYHTASSTRTLGSDSLGRGAGTAATGHGRAGRKEGRVSSDGMRHREAGSEVVKHKWRPTPDAPRSRIP